MARDGSKRIVSLLYSYSERLPLPHALDELVLGARKGLGDGHVGQRHLHGTSTEVVTVSTTSTRSCVPELGDR